MTRKTISTETLSRGDTLTDPSLSVTNAHSPTEPTPLTHLKRSDPDFDEEALYHRKHKEYIEALVTSLLPPDISESLKATILLHLHSYGVILQASNDSAFQIEDMSERTLDPHIVEIVEKAKRSLASPVELLVLNQATGMPSVELKKLTHPFGYRNEYLSSMDQEVAEAIHSLGGVYDISPDAGKSVSILPDKYNTDGFIVITKERIGAVNGLIVRRRKTYAINVASADFYSKIRNRINDVDKSLPQNVWLQQLVKNTRFEDYVEASIAFPEDAPYLHELSTMIYSHHPDRGVPKDEETQREYQRRHSDHLARRAMDMSRT